ncbi:FAD-dependent oxidoreductase, partial [Nocardia mexicana]|uniref:FAD-dependent oxidoreductase n=1 Tax=Nocardia mexicana TaxID=279262 RepID=UPI00083040C4
MKILIVGAGIAGSAAAQMLAHDGHDVDVVDAAPRPQSGGYQILFDRIAMRLFDQIGASETVNALSAPTATIAVARGRRTLATLTTEGYRSARRGDLVGAISEYVANRVPMRFGRELVGIEHRAAGVAAHFDDGSSSEYDLLIGADGLNSTVRRLAVEIDGSDLYLNGRVNLWVNVPGRVAGTTHAAILLGDRIGAQVFPYTDHDETLVLTTILTGAERREKRELLPLAVGLLEASGPRYAGFAEHVAHAAIDEVRVTRFAQVRARRWHARNVVLLGDAAHCIDPLSGAGAHGALLGAAVFAEELRRTPDSIAAAATRYARRVRPFARSAQFLTAGLVERATSHGIAQRAAADLSLAAAAFAVRRRDV